MPDIEQQVIELIMLKLKEDKLTEQHKTRIHEIAEQCKGDQIVQGVRSEMQDTERKYKEGMTAEETYIDMINKIAKAPTWIHATYTARILICIIDEKIRGEKGKMSFKEDDPMRYKQKVEAT